MQFGVEVFSSRRRGCDWRRIDPQSIHVDLRVSHRSQQPLTVRCHSILQDARNWSGWLPDDAAAVKEAQCALREEEKRAKQMSEQQQVRRYDTRFPLP